MSNYKTLSNDPFGRCMKMQSCVGMNDVFNQEELRYLNEYMNTLELDDGVLTYEQTSRLPAGSVGHRISKTKFVFPNEDTQWMFERYNGAVDKLNQMYYNFDLNGFNELQFTEYRSGDGGKFDFHGDIHYGEPPSYMFQMRKLSIVVLLNSEFQGGEFQINTKNEIDSQTIQLKPGTMIAFPSWVLHRVTPVTKGNRRSLVTWVLGPKFR
jgi:PKHD-type hydroxylase